MAQPVDPTAVIAGAAVPAMLMSAGGLFALALYNRLAAIVARLRALAREQADGGRSCPPVGEEVASVLARARLVRGALLCLVGALALFAACSLGQGLARLWPAAGWAALAAFVSGQGLLVAGLLLALIELLRALGPVQMEAKWAAAQRRPAPGRPAPPEGREAA
jgi:hypothetical protein